MTSRKRIRKT